MKRDFICVFICILCAFSVKAQDLIMDSRNVKFNDSIFMVLRPKGYNYFQNSIFKNKTIEEFTNSNLSPYKIRHFEFFVPDDVDKKPSISVYSFEMLEGLELTQDKFEEHKKFIIKSYETGAYNKISEKLFTDTSFVKQKGKVQAQQTGYFVLTNAKKLLTTVIIINSSDDRDSNSAIISNDIFIKGTILTIKLTIDYKNFNDLSALKDISDWYIREFLKANNVKN